MVLQEQRRPMRPVPIRRTPELVLREYEKIQIRNPKKDIKSWFEAAKTSRTRKRLPNGQTYFVVDHPEVHTQLGGIIETKSPEKPILLISSKLSPVEQESLAIKIYKEWLTQKAYRKEQATTFARSVKSRYIELVKTIEPQLIAQLNRCPKDGKRYFLKIGKFTFIGQYNSKAKQFEVSPLLSQGYAKIFANTNTSSVVFVYKE